MEREAVSAVNVLMAARAAGIRIAIDGDVLALDADAAPPTVILDLLLQHKADIVELLRADVAPKIAKGLSPRYGAVADAARRLAEPPAGPRPVQVDITACHVCGDPETQGKELIPVLTDRPGKRYWIHRHCWDEHIRRAAAHRSSALLEDGRKA